MTKNRWQGVGYHRNPRLTFYWHLYGYIRVLKCKVFTTKDNFKVITIKTRLGHKPMFKRNMKCNAPYSARYNFKTQEIVIREKESN